MFYAKIYTVCAATLVGLGKPFFSGSVEAFYQDAIESRRVGDGDHIKANTSFILSSGFGKALPAIYIVGSFLIVAVLQVFDLAKIAFLFGAALYLLVVLRLRTDGQNLGDNSHSQRQFPSFGALTKILKSPDVIWSSILKALNWLIVIYIMGHGIIVIANEKQFGSDAEKMIVYFLFMLSFMGLGWFVRGSLNPYLFKRFNHQKIVLISYILWALFNIVMMLLLSGANFTTTCFLISIYMTAFQICYSMWQDWSANLLLQSVDREVYASALSLQNIPGFILVSLMNIYFSTFVKGYPGMNEMYGSLACLSFAGALLMTVFICGNKHAKKISSI
jgi:hypothetical protein